MKRFLLRNLLGFFAVVALTACNAENIADQFVGTSAAPAAVAPTTTGLTLNIVGGNNQTDAAGATFHDPIAVQLLQNGSPVAGKLVTFTAVSGSVTFGASSGLTDASGMVNTYVTAGATSGAVSVRANYNGTTADFSLNIANQSNATLVRISGNSQSGNVGATLAQPFIVETRDSGTGNPLPNILVRFTVVSGNGRLNSSNNTLTLSTDGTGRASVNFDVGTLAGANSVTAVVVSVPAQNTSFAATGVVPATSTVSVSQSDITSAAGSLAADGSQTTTLTLTIRDAYGNAIPTGGKSITFAVNTGTLVGSVTAHANGTYTQTVRAPASTTPASIQVTGTVDGVALTSAALAINLTSGSVSLAQSTVSSAANSITANGTSTVLVTLTLRDSLGNQITTGGQTVSFSSTLGSFIGSITDVGDGTYTQTLLAGTLSGSAVVSATVSSISATPIASTKTIALLAGAPDATKSTVIATPSVMQPNGTSVSIITVQLRDAYSNLSTTAVGRSVTLTKTNGTWMGSALATIAGTDNGDGTYSGMLVAAATAGNSTIQATDNGTILSKTAMVYFTNGAAGPSVSTSLVSITGSTVLPADGVSTITVKVTLKDSYGAQLASGGSVVVISTTAGTKIGSVLDNGDGTYAQVIRAPTTAAIATITATTDGNTIARSVTESFYGPASLAQSSITAAPGSIIANGSAVTVLYLNAKDTNGVAIPVGGETGITFAATQGTLLGSVTDNGNGTYSQQLRATASAATSTVTASKGGSAFSSTTSVDFYVPNNRAGLTIDCSNIATYQNTTILVDSGTLTMNSKGVNGNCPTQFVFAGIILQNSAILTHTATTEAQEYGLEVTANYMTIDATSKIDVTGKGYPNSSTAYKIRTQGNINVDAPSSSTGGSYGGQGMSSAGAGIAVNATYGSLYEPLDLGTAGSSYAGQYAGSGGGRLKLTLTGPAGLSNAGSIKSDGGLIVAGHGGGGGSGGSIWINTTALSGAGTITANGSATDTNGTLRQGGSGGRVAIYYTSTSTLSGNFSYPTNLLANVKSMGGYGTGNCAAGAGTVYFKSASQTYGDLVIDNKGNPLCTSTNGTVINSPSISANEAVDAHTLTKTGVFADSYSTVTPYKRWFLDPNPAQNTTPTKTDNQLYSITSATANIVTTSGGDMSAVASVGNAAELVLIFDNFEIGDKTLVSAGNLRILSYGGDLRSNDATTVTMTDTMPPAGVEYLGAQSVTLNLNARTVPQFLVEDFANADLTVLNGTLNFNNLKARNFVANTMTLNGTSLTTSANVTFSTVTANFSQNVGSYSIQASGNLDISNSSTVYQVASTLTLEHSLEISASSLSLSANSTISAYGRGYKQSLNHYFRVFGNQDTLAWNASTQTAAGGSHGGRGSTAGGYYSSEVWGSFKNPYTSGGSGGWDLTSGPGGGIIRITITGNGAATINGTVDARGSNVSNPSGAGGSIYLLCGALSGTGSLDARGGSTSWAGGGGRIAVYYNSLAGNFTYPTNALANIKTWGGSDGSAAGTAAAGTLFMKGPSDTYGKLIVNNNSQLFSDTAGRRTVINLPAPAASTGITYNSGTGKSTLTSANAFIEKYGSSSAYVGMFLNPNIAQNATTKIADDTMYEIVAQTANTLVVQGNATATGTSGNTFQLNLKLDTLKVVGNAMLEVNGGVILANDLDITNGQVVGTGSVESYPTAVTTLNPNGGTINFNTIGNTASMTLQNGTFVFPNNSTVTTTGNLTFTSATISGTGISYNVTGDMSSTSSTFAAQNITTSGSLSFASSTATIAGNVNVTQNMLVNNSSTVTQAVSASVTTGGNLTVSNTSTFSGTRYTVGGNLLVDGVGTLVAGNRVLTPFTTYNTVPAVVVTGDATISNASYLISQNANSTEEFYLYLSAANLTVDGSSYLHADGKGYHNVTDSRFRTLGNTDSLGYNGNTSTTNTAAAAAYGGFGGSASPSTYFSNRPYGNFQNPIYLGTSGSCWGGAGCNDNGGGAIRLNISGTSTINGVLSATGNQASSTGGSGGSVYVRTGTLAGSGIIRANGSQNGTGGFGGGGGGRVAIYYTNSSGGFASMSTRLSNIQAWGGTYPGAGLNAKGSAGTIFLKQDSQTYGDMIVNNNNLDSNYTTPFSVPAANSVSSVTSTTLSSPIAFANVFGNIPDFFKGYFINPNIAQNATNKLSDDTVFMVDSNTATTATTTTTGMDSISTVGNTWALVAIFDNLEVKGKGQLYFPGQNIRVISGDIGSNNATSFVQDGIITARVVDVGPGVNWTTTANATGSSITTQCASNFSCP